MMKKNTMVLLGLVLTGAAFNSALAKGDVAAGQAKAATCAACHGPIGNSSNEQFPDLAGQKESYLAEQIRAYRDGGRENPLMTPMAAGLSDADIDNLAAFFAAQTPK